MYELNGYLVTRYDGLYIIWAKRRVDIYIFMMPENWEMVGYKIRVSQTSVLMCRNVLGRVMAHESLSFEGYIDFP